jgi:hypothetical protein
MVPGKEMRRSHHRPGYIVVEKGGYAAHADDKETRIVTPNLSKLRHFAQPCPGYCSFTPAPSTYNPPLLIFHPVTPHFPFHKQLNVTPR